MEKIAAIVEGHTEAHFIASTYGNVWVQRPIPNGREVAIQVIVDAILDALETISGSIKRVLILLDREKRPISAADLLAAIMAGIAPHTVGRQIYIGVADRQIENWIVADESCMRAKFDPNYIYPGDGNYGKSILSDLAKGVSWGPRDTALLLKECSAKNSAQNSPSLGALIDTVDFDWAWAKS